MRRRLQMTKHHSFTASVTEAADITQLLMMGLAHMTTSGVQSNYE
jgi:hypothetical protein